MTVRLAVSIPLQTTPTALRGPALRIPAKGDAMDATGAASRATRSVAAVAWREAVERWRTEVPALHPWQAAGA